MQRVTLTIIMPAYNASHYINHTIKAIIDQTFPDWRLIVIDDCSSDDTATIVTNWQMQDARVQLVCNDTNMKVARTMNKGIALIDSEYFARIDADDVPIPSHFEKIIAYLEKNQNVGFCGSQVMTIDENGNFRRKWNYETDVEWVKISSVFACPFLQSAVIMRTDVIRSIGGYREDMELVEDYELWLRALREHDGANIPDYTMQYRIHSSNMSETNKSAILKKLEVVYREYKSHYPIDTDFLALHSRMEFGDWSGISNTEWTQLKTWKQNLCCINIGMSLKNEKIYSDVLKKYFTNAYLKIATQNRGRLRVMSLWAAGSCSLKWLRYIYIRKKSNNKP